MRKYEALILHSLPFKPAHLSATLSRIICSLLLLLYTGKVESQCVSSSTVSFSFTPIHYDSADIVAPGRGVEQWHDQNSVNVPVEGINTARLDKYYRFSWSQFESTTQGVYDFTDLDNEINDAIDNGQQFSFGIMPTCSNSSGAGVYNLSGSLCSYPQYLHTLMQSETVTDWVSPLSNMWIPNWNSNYYLTALENLYSAINTHLNTTTYAGVRYKDVINYIDVRGYGNFGEWHLADIVTIMSDHPTGTRASVATLKRIIDAHVNAFTDHPLVIMISTFDGNRLLNTQNDPEVGYHALTRQNNFGKLGWRRDNWAALDSYISDYLENNSTTYSGMTFSTEIMDRWKIAPVVGEPIQTGPVYNSCAYGALEDQVLLYHATSFGNGNYLSTSASCMRDNVRAASKAAGYRLILEGGSVTSSFTSGTPFSISLDWKNLGIAPSYELWDAYYELRNASTNQLIWTGRSTFTPKRFLPDTTAFTATDNFTLPATITNGNYNLNLVIKDPADFREPLPLAITGRNLDGSYTLATVILAQATATTTGSLTATVSLQGRPATPHASWIVPLDVKFYVTGNPNPVLSYQNVMTNDQGEFTIHCIPPGTYSIAVKQYNSLQRVLAGQTIITGNNTASFAVLIAGDANNDGIIDAIDLSLLQSSYGYAIGHLLYDFRTDFNNDNTTSLVDFSLLASNYLQVNETP